MHLGRVLLLSAQILAAVVESDAKFGSVARTPMRTELQGNGGQRTIMVVLNEKKPTRAGWQCDNRPCRVLILAARSKNYCCHAAVFHATQTSVNGVISVNIL